MKPLTSPVFLALEKPAKAGEQVSGGSSVR
jgi:hypothetical protein